MVDAQHLPHGRRQAGDRHLNFHEPRDNLLVGHAELFEPESDNSSGPESPPEPVYIFVNTDEPTSLEDEAELADALAALALLGVLVAAPHLKKWWSDRALPVLKDKWAKLSLPRRAKRLVSATETSDVAEPDPTPPRDVFDALDEYSASMSSVEARERFITALVARIFSERQLRLLRHSRIEDEGGSLELASAMETLTPQQLEDSLRTMLEANPSWPDQETVAELRKLLGGGRGDPEALPLQVGKR